MCLLELVPETKGKFVEEKRCMIRWECRRPHQDCCTSGDKSGGLELEDRRGSEDGYFTFPGGEAGRLLGNASWSRQLIQRLNSASTTCMLELQMCTSMPTFLQCQEPN